MTSALRRVVIDIGWSFSSLDCGRRPGRDVVQRGRHKWYARALHPRNRGQYSKTPGEASGNWQHVAPIVAANARAQGPARAVYWWSMIFFRKPVSTFRDHALRRVSG